MRWICCEGGTCEPPVRVTTPAAGSPALKAKDLAAAKALLKDPEITVVEVAKRLGVCGSLDPLPPPATGAGDRCADRGRRPGVYKETGSG